MRHVNVAAGHDAVRLGSDQRGFTLIELLVVIVADLDPGGDGDGAVPELGAKARRKRCCKTDLFRMRDAIDQYYADKGKYPASLDALVTRRLPAQDSRGSDHPVGRHLADGPGGAGPEQSDRRAGHLRRQERRQGTALDGTKYSDWK